MPHEPQEQSTGHPPPVPALPVAVVRPPPPARAPADVVVVVPEVEAPPTPMGRARFSKRRLAVAFGIAAVSDVVSALLTFAPPAEWTVDFATAVLLFMVLGWHWVLLPGLVMEAIPGLSVFPFWVLVVGAIAMWGTARPQGLSARGERVSR